MTKIFPLSNSIQFVNSILEGTGEEPGKIQTKKFSDGEIKVEIHESVRGKRVVIVGSLRTSDDIMEMVMAGDAARRASAKDVIALIPYLPYMRQDRKDVPRTAIGAKVIANMIEVSGFNQLITLDLHVSQIEGFFNIPVTHVEGSSIFTSYIKRHWGNLEEFMVVSPDVGGAKRAKKFAGKLGLPLAIINKEREMANQVSSMELIGNVDGKNVILVDDMVDTAGSICKAADILLENGAISVSACITHGVLSGSAVDRIKKSQLDMLYVSDSINISNLLEDIDFKKRIKVVSGSNVFRNILHMIEKKQSINSMINEL